ncbi:MAG TPA: DegT/DnrJ/EryC1/StrS family aminotransferase [Solirubrobacteraceae bacterium]
MLDRARVRVPANDFAFQWQEVREDAMAAVDRVGRSGWLVLGEEVRAFERELAEWWGIPHAIGVASGLDALEIALRCAGLPPGARVLTTPLTAFATTLAIIRAGCEPVWCDVDQSGGLDLEQAEAVLSADRSIRALMPVHLYGHPMDLRRLEQLAAEHEITLVEDCAQSVGAERDGRATGAASIACGTSLYPTKNLGAMGDGGVVLTADAAVAEHARRLRNYGQSGKYEHEEIGLNSRLDELHAAILRSAFMPRLEQWLARRRLIAHQYVEALRSSALRPLQPAGGRSAHHLFPVEVIEGDPQAVATSLSELGIGIGRHYPFLCSDQPAARGISPCHREHLPVSRRIAARELSLPIYPQMTDAEIESVIDACLEVCK